MSLEFTLVRRAIRLAAIDGPDTGDNPDILQAQGSVLFEPVMKKGDSVQVQTRGGSETYVLAPIECPINDGIISHRGQDGVKLPAGGEAANPSIIRWKATFSRMQAGGKSFTLAPVVFDAIPGGEIDLTMVAPVAGAPEGVVRGPRGTSLEAIVVDGSELVFTAVDDAGSFEIARIPLDDVVRAEADAAAAAAVDGVETVLAATVDAANAARDDAKGHADRAEGAASTATSAAGEASQSKDAAATSESNALQSENDAAQDAARAEAAQAEAVQAQAGAETAETNAAASEQAAATSASNAATSEANAQDSATAAAGSAAESAAHADRAEQAADPAGLRDEITQQLADLVDGAPEDLDTIREVAEYAQANRDITDTLNAAIGAKADATDASGRTVARYEPGSSQWIQVGDNPAWNGEYSNGGALNLRSADSRYASKASTQALADGLAGKADAAVVNARPALFSGTGAPPSTIPNARVGDWWLNQSTMELSKITGV